MKYTSNYNLKKPEGTDVVNIDDFNDNADTIDQQLKNVDNSKVDKVAGKQLSTEDYTTTEKTKLAGIAANANNYVHPTTAGNKHIPTGGSVGQILKNTASGTATWQNETITPIANNLTTTVAGKALDATQGKVLKDDLDEHKAELATQDEAGHIKLSDIPMPTKEDIGLSEVTNHLQFHKDNYGNIITKASSFTLSLAEENTVLSVTAAATITIPNNTTVSMPIGTQITVIANTTANVTFVPASGVSLYSKDTKRIIDGQYASATLIKSGANIWQLIGALK